MATRFSRAYLLTKVLTANNREVILYLYEGALSYLSRALEAREADEAAESAESIDRTIAILIELSSSLDYNHDGTLALRLDSIYNYMIEVLTQSNSTQDVAPIATCESILTILCDAWRQAIETEKTDPEPTQQSQLQISA